MNKVYDLSMIYSKLDARANYSATHLTVTTQQTFTFHNYV